MSDRFTFNFRESRGWLKPASAEAEEWLRTMKPGKEVLVRGWAPRNPRFHRFVFAVLQRCVDATGERWPNVDTLRKGLLVQMGYSREWMTLDGEVRIEADSMAFASMPEDKFKAFWNEAKMLLDTHVLYDASEEARAEIFAMIDGQLAQLR